MTDLTHNSPPACMTGIFNRLKTRPSQRESVFTLVELLIVIIIIAILSAIAIPVYLTVSNTAAQAVVRQDASTVSGEVKIDLATEKLQANPTSLATGSYNLSHATESVSFTQDPTAGTLYSCVYDSSLKYSVISDLTNTGKIIGSGTGDCDTYTHSSAATAAVTAAANTGTSFSAPSGMKLLSYQDFNTDAAQGSFATTYRHWDAYGEKAFKDTSKNGVYTTAYQSVSNGVMDCQVKTVSGQPYGCAITPLLLGAANTSTLYTYPSTKSGSFTIRMKEDTTAGYKAEWMLWAYDGASSEGEVDFPEGTLGDTVKGYSHMVGNNAKQVTFSYPSVSTTAWHLYTINWNSTQIQYLIDGVVVNTITNLQYIPQTAFRPLFQVETQTSGGKPAAAATGHVYVDYIKVYGSTN